MDGQYGKLYKASNLQLIVNDFFQSGISEALDGHDDTEDTDDQVLEDTDEVSDDTSDG